MNDKPIPNPFEAARRIAALSVMLQPHDLIEAWPTLTEVQVAAGAGPAPIVHRRADARRRRRGRGLTILRQERAIS